MSQTYLQSMIFDIYASSKKKIKQDYTSKIKYEYDDSIIMQLFKEAIENELPGFVALNRETQEKKIVIELDNHVKYRGVVSERVATLSTKLMQYSHSNSCFIYNSTKKAIEYKYYVITDSDVTALSSSELKAELETEGLVFKLRRLLGK